MAIKTFASVGVGIECHIGFWGQSWVEVRNCGLWQTRIKAVVGHGNGFFDQHREVFHMALCGVVVAAICNRDKAQTLPSKKRGVAFPHPPRNARRFGNPKQRVAGKIRQIKLSLFEGLDQGFFACFAVPISDQCSLVYRRMLCDDVLDRGGDKGYKMSLREMVLKSVQQGHQTQIVPQKLRK